MPACSTNARARLVLCVDDDQSVLSVTRLALEYEGYTVLTASNGRAALQEFASQPVDAVVLDYDMPGMDGGEVALEMKRMNPDVPKLMFSSCLSVPMNAAHSIQEFCRKTDGLSSLLPRLQRMLQTTQPRAQLI